jgi:hypothetical protein
MEVLFWDLNILKPIDLLTNPLTISYSWKDLVITSVQGRNSSLAQSLANYFVFNQIFVSSQALNFFYLVASMYQHSWEQNS